MPVVGKSGHGTETSKAKTRPVSSPVTIAGPFDQSVATMNSGRPSGSEGTRDAAEPSVDGFQHLALHAPYASVVEYVRVPDGGLGVEADAVWGGRLAQPCQRHPQTSLEVCMMMRDTCALCPELDIPSGMACPG